MKAWVLKDIGDIKYEEVPLQEPGSGFVMIKVMAAGICGSDVPRVYRTGAHRMPLIPGHEFSGMVEETGEGTDPQLKGKRVGVFPLIPCRKCGPCRQQLYEMCRDYDYLGSRRDGAFAEYVCAPADNLIELPSGVSFETAAMLEPMAVAVHAMRKGTSGIVKDAAVCVCGLGTIGLMLCAFLKDAGFERIIAVGNKDSQKERAADAGIAADAFIDSRDGGVSEKIKDICGGADLYFECVGKNECLSYGVEAAAPGGRIVTVGNPASDMLLEKNIYWKILRNQLDIRGTWNSSFTGEESDDWHYVLDRLNAGGINAEKFISHRLRLTELDKGLKIMRDKTEDYCKVMISASG
ncbi:MAG: galactitol-1-phosphate 5-dehydrogenase [Lachnospiraceae bacterium]|nr:galactitol-1-phosphate 5-dehydrogenase [Lachnospiraceae bacterium]